MSEKKSNFSVTCSLLSQFLKEKRSLAELGVPRPYEPNKVLFRPPTTTTMSLLPGAGVSAETETETDTTQTVTAKSMVLFPQQTGFGSVDNYCREPGKSQLTIFYGGKVLVFDNFPADKATDLVQLAAKGSSSAAPAAPAAASALADRLPVCCPSTSGSRPVSEQEPAPSGNFPEAKKDKMYFSLLKKFNIFTELPMPIARRASLHRFFAKRKDRITSKAPYQVNENSSPVSDSGKPEETRSWLGSDP